jgi:hypothetical protein
MVESKKPVYTHKYIGIITNPTKNSRLGRRKRYPDMVSLRTKARLIVACLYFLLIYPHSSYYNVKTHPHLKGMARVRA